ncbi:MAG: molybdopterin dinucleotide binding domain-containing protein, partial [Pseudomonadota bacterium]
PLPSQWAEDFGYGVQTPSGKIEFVPEILKRNEARHPERPALNRYIPSWEGPRTKELVERFPLQMIATHSRYSFHTYSDGSPFTNQIKDHRTEIDGQYYWILRLSPEDAEARGIEQDDLVKIFNDRGAVICAADVSHLVKTGVVKSYESSANYQLLEVNGENVEVGGSLNILTPERPQVLGTHSMSPNSTLVQVEKYQHADALKKARAA